MEIKSHVLGEKELHQERAEEEIIAEMIPPEKLAARYLEELGVSRSGTDSGRDDDEPDFRSMKSIIKEMVRTAIENVRDGIEASLGEGHGRTVDEREWDIESAEKLFIRFSSP